MSEAGASIEPTDDDALAELDEPTSAIRLSELWPVAVGGGLGVLARYNLTRFRWSPTIFPLWLQEQWLYLVMNSVGAFALGLALAFFHTHPQHGQRLFLTTGFLGGFTTYGTIASFEQHAIIASAPSGTVLLSLGVNLSIGVAAAYAGERLGQCVFQDVEVQS